MKELIKRKTGGQPGNQNARKHGFYSRVLTREEKIQLKHAVGVDGLDQEISILRIKFRSLLCQDGSNFYLINQTAKTLARLYSVKYGLNKNDSSALKEAVTSILSEFTISRDSNPDSQS